MSLSSSEQERLHFKDHRVEARMFGARAIGGFVAVLLLFGLLIYRFYDLQIVQHQHYVTRAESNRIQVQAVPPTRGLIYDRNGILLADNRASYTLSVVRERTQDLAQTLAKIGELITVEDKDLDNFHRALRQRRRPYEAVPLRYGLTEEEIAKIAVNEYRLDGVEVEAQLVRHYPFGELFAHVIGYVGRINEREMMGFDADSYRRYSGTHTIGKVGLERYYERQLLGDAGSQHIETNAHGRVLRVLGRVDPKPGQDLHLHLDTELQKAATEALGDYRGAVVAIDVATGGVLASVSLPTYDANLFVTGISYGDYKALRDSIDLPLFNRTIQGQYPPGSTLKPMFGVGALETGATDVTRTIRDPGFYRLPGDSRLYRDWRRYGHGDSVDLRQAIVESCDTYFYDLAVRMTIDEMYPLGQAFGLGTRTGIDIPSERPGLWPSREWKRGARGLPWFPGDSLNVSIGQGDVLTTPMQLAVMTAIMANRGTQLRPQMVSRVETETVPPEVVGQWFASQHHWDFIDSTMQGVVHGQRGTARSALPDLGYRMAAKTGTAQVVGIAQGEQYDRELVRERNRDHALFVAYAPAENPQIAVAVIVENGEFGSSTAGPMARKVFDRWFALEQARKSEDSTAVITRRTP